MQRRPSSAQAASPSGGRSPLSFFSALVLLIATCCATPLPAQNATQSAPESAAPYTLHLYARLVELPTLIFFSNSRKPPTVTPQQINIRLNSAHPFHPISLRMEGNDPLSIGILLDVSGDQRELVSAIQKDLSAWVTHSLLPHDHVSLYALDCNLVQTSNDVPADPVVLQKGLDLALASPLPHGDSGKPSCGKSIRLRGSIIVVLRKLGQLPGRRVLLVVSACQDNENKIQWTQLTSEAGLDSVSVFGLTSQDSIEQAGDLYKFTRQSGGLLFAPTTAMLPSTLDRMVALLRGRYILQFPMPPSLMPVVYHVFVTLPKFNATTLPSGITVPFPNPSLDHPSTDLPYQGPPPDSVDPPPAAQPSTPNP